MADPTTQPGPSEPVPLHDRVFQLLSRPAVPHLKATSEFCCWEPLPRSNNPGIEVPLPGGGRGMLALPVGEQQAAALKAVCSLAPFGRGEQTLRGTDVRHTWQLQPESFSVRNPRWHTEVVALAVRRTKEMLGLSSDTEVEAQLYRLLLYEPGSHFKPHRDSEKADGMFATLSILLPSHYKGGQLMVRHVGKECLIDLAATNSHTSCFAAFYSDCEHEILRLTSGYRLELVYNLCYSWHGPPPPQVHSGAAGSLAQLLQEWGRSTLSQSPMKLCFILQHRYTAASMRQHGLACLKGQDRVAAKVLLAACQLGAELDVHLALLTIVSLGEETQCGDPEVDEYQREQPWYIKGDMPWSCFEASTLTQLAGPAPPFSTLRFITRDEVACSPDWWQHAMPDKREEIDARYVGLDVQRWYYRAGLVFWPASRRLVNAVQVDPRHQALRLPAMLVHHLELAASHCQQMPCATERQDEQEADKVSGGGSETGGRREPAFLSKNPSSKLAELAAAAISSLGERERKDAAAEEEAVARLAAAGTAEGAPEDSEDENWRRKKEADLAAEREGRQYWGPQPAAEPRELALAIAHYFAGHLGRFPYHPQHDSVPDILRLVAGCAQQLGDAELAGVVLEAMAATPDMQEELVLLVACFGWPASWHSKLRSALLQPPDGVKLIQACLAAAESSAAAGKTAHVAASRQALEQLGLQLARMMADAARGHIPELSLYYASMKDRLLGLNGAACWAHTAAARFALEQGVACVMARYVICPGDDAYQCPTSSEDLAEAVSDLCTSAGVSAVAGSASLVKLVASWLVDVTAAVGPPIQEPADWRKDIQRWQVMCEKERRRELCSQCRALKAFLADPEERQLTLALDPAPEPPAVALLAMPFPEDPVDHAVWWARRFDRASFADASMQDFDIQYHRHDNDGGSGSGSSSSSGGQGGVQPEEQDDDWPARGLVDSVTITKQHGDYARALAWRQKVLDSQRTLLDLWTDTLLHLLAAGGNVAGGGAGSSAAGGQVAAPPASASTEAESPGSLHASRAATRLQPCAETSPAAAETRPSKRAALQDSRQL